MTTSSELLSFAEYRFISLATFRKSGVAVATPVWVVRDGDALLVTTPTGTGKLKRLANNTDVEFRPCSRSGKVADGAPVAYATAEVIDTPELRAHNVALLKKKHGVEYAIFTFVEGFFRKNDSRNVTIRLTPREG